MKETIGILLLGAGQMAEEHGRAYFNNPEFSILAICDSDMKKASKLSEKLGFVPVFGEISKALKNVSPDALSICTWADSHFYYAQLGLESGMQVFVEKPPALNLEDYKTLLNISKTRKNVLMSGFILHWHDAYTEWIELSRNLTSPINMNICFLQHTHGKKWESQRRQLKFCSPLLDTGIHYIDILLHIAGDTPTHICCRGDNTPGGSGSFPNHYQLDLEFANGSQAQLEVGWGPFYPPKGKHVKKLVAENGNLSLIYPSAGTQIVSGILGDEPVQLAFSKSRTELCALQAEKFAMAIKGEFNLETHHNRTLLAMEIIEKAETSRKCCEKIPIRLNGFEVVDSTEVKKLRQVHSPMS